MSDVLSFVAAVLHDRAVDTASRLQGGTIRLYSAPQPASPDTAVTTQTLLAEAAIPDPLTVSGSVISATLGSTVVLTSGEPTWARFFDALDAPVCDGSVALEGDEGAVTLDNLSLIAGAGLIGAAFAITET